MAITNISKPTSSIGNQTKINIGLTWDAATMTWDAANFTWDSTVSVIGNASKGITGFIWTVSRFPWTESTPWLTEGGITNQSKP